MKSSIRIGKEVDINILKGLTYDHFNSQNRAQRIIAKTFSKFKGIATKKCIICNSKLIHSKVKILQIEFLNCKKCNHVFRKYYYNKDSLKNFFENDNLLNVHSHKNQENYRSKYLSQPKVNQVLKFIKNKKIQWLDLGCGNGEFLSQVKKYGCIPYGFDLNEEDIKKCKKKKIYALKSDLFSFYNYANKKKLKFDVVSATGYFDMVNDPMKELSIVSRMMNKNSLIMVDLPNFESITHDTIRAFPEKSIRHLNACQRSSFTFKSLQFFLKKNSFKIIFQWKYGLDIYMLLNIFAQNNKNFYSSRICRLFEKRFNDFQKIIDEENFADTLFVIAKKL